MNFKTSLIIFICLILVSCTGANQGTISEKGITEAIVLCESNDGLLGINVKGNNFVVTCTNNASKVFSQKDKDNASKNSPSIVAEEVKACLDLCTKNNGLKEMHANTECTHWVSAGRASYCKETSDQATCVCQNGISRASDKRAMGQN